MKKELRCNVCHKALVGNDPEVVTCKQLGCQEVAQLRSLLANQIASYKEFFTENSPSEENYKKYLEQTHREEQYQEHCTELGMFNVTPPSRRVYFQMHVSAVHAGWPDEFGRSFAEKGHEPVTEHADGVKE